MRKSVDISKFRKLNFGIPAAYPIFLMRRLSLFLFLGIIMPSGVFASQLNLSLPTKVAYKFDQVVQVYYSNMNRDLTYFPLEVIFHTTRVPDKNKSGYRFGGPASFSQITIVKEGVEYIAPSKCLPDLSWPIQAIGAMGIEDTISIEIKTVGLRDPSEKRGLVLDVNTESQSVTCSYKLTEDW